MIKEEPDHKDIWKKIVSNYGHLETTIVEQLQFSVEHHLTTGVYREGIWKSLFEQIVPKKFSIEQSVFIVDSNHNVSKEVDLVIFDEQYTPYIFRYGNIKYIPIEAVAVVIQCKSTNVNGKKNVETLEKWAKSIDDLRTSLKSVTRLHQGLTFGLDFIMKADLKDAPGNVEDRLKTTQTSTRPIKILCYTAKIKPSSSIKEKFDIILHPVGDRLNIVIPESDSTLNLVNWHEKLNHVDDRYKNYRKNVANPQLDGKEITLQDYRVCSENNEERSLLSLTFQLNQLLMLINNPIFFPHLAYVEMFKQYIVEEKQVKGKSAGTKAASSDIG